MWTDNYRDMTFVEKVITHYYEDIDDEQYSNELFEYFGIDFSNSEQLNKAKVLFNYADKLDNQLANYLENNSIFTDCRTKFIFDTFSELIVLIK